MKKTLLITLLFACTIQFGFAQANQKQALINKIENILEYKATNVKLGRSMSNSYIKQAEIIIPLLESMSLKDVEFYYEVYDCVDIMQHVNMLEYMQSNPNYKKEIIKNNINGNITYDIGEFSQFFSNNSAMQKFGKNAY